MRVFLTFGLLVFSIISIADPALDREIQTAQFSAFAEALSSQNRIPQGATIKFISVVGSFNNMAVFFTRRGQHEVECYYDSGVVVSKEADGKTVYSVNFSGQPETKVGCQ